MKKTISLLAIFFVLTGVLRSQEATFTVKVHSDSILSGNPVKVSFTMENGNAQSITPPKWDGMKDIQGPSVQMQTSIINGAATSKTIWTYYMTPEKEGDVWIGPATATSAGQALETAPVKVRVFPNPDNIRVNPDEEEQRDLFGNMRPFFREAPRDRDTAPQEDKPKRKLYKI